MSLKLTIIDELSDDNKINEFKYRNKPFANSEVISSKIKNFELLTNGSDVKRVYDLELTPKNYFQQFLPGDAIGIFPQNDNDEVSEIIKRLGLQSQENLFYELENIKQKPLPKHLPEKGLIKDLFTKYVDIRRPPKKLFLKQLINFTKDSEEVKALEIICSPKGSKYYFDLINNDGTLSGILNRFKTCYPPLEIILEHSLPLQPRFFSISSSPLEKTLHITFSVVDLKNGRKGVCTGWLETLINEQTPDNISFYYRAPTKFRLRPDLTVPIILIATGTGIAPFKSFLDNKQRLGNKENCILFYGCRYQSRDFLYKKIIDNYVAENVLSELFVAFSRETDKKIYVQDKIEANCEKVVELILGKNALIYICGDLNTTVKSVKESLVMNFIKSKFDENLAKILVKELIEEEQLFIDSWT